MQIKQLGFIGLGVMGEPVCRNLIQKSGLPVVVYDRNPDPAARMAAHGATIAASAAEVMRQSDVVWLSLPSGEAVRQLVLGDAGLLRHARAGQVVADLGTSPVELTRDLAAQFAQAGATFVDTPMARTRAAAEAGALSIMVGADAPVFERIRPLIATFAADITHCGPVGCGQIAKILNNMVLFESVVALSEAAAIARRSGMDPRLLFDALSKGSADSFALRNHGVKAILAADFPLKAFPVAYARKDLSYALDLAESANVDARAAKVVDAWFAHAIDAGLADRYFPIVSQVIDAEGSV